MKKVFLLGVFDLFHIGHLRLINKSANLGRLNVGVVCDEAVRREKGDGKPVINEYQRLEIVNNLRSVNLAFIIPDFAIPKDVLEKWQTIVIGEDQFHIKNLDEIPKDRIYKMSRTGGISTSDIIKKIKVQ